MFYSEVSIMLELLVGISIVSIYIGMILFIFVRMLIRIWMVVYNKYELKSAIKLVFIPLSIGVYGYYKKNDRLLKFYQIVEIVTGFFLLLGSFFLFYTRFA